MSVRVSLAMPVYNGANFLPAALDSILAQDYADFELIVTDNASTDATMAICFDYAQRDRRVRYHRNDGNLGAAANYNLGLELAQGEFLKWCAHDDTISPNYVSACVATMVADPTVSLAFGRTRAMDASGVVSSDDAPLEMQSLNGDSPIDRFSLAMSTAGNCYPIFGLNRVTALRQSTGHRPYYCSDRALIAEMALLGKVRRVEEAMLFNRIHAQQSYRQLDRRVRQRWQASRASRAGQLEDLNLLRHLLEIASRHDHVSHAAAKLSVLRYAASPERLLRYLLDIVRFISPGALDAVKRMRPPSHAM